MENSFVQGSMVTVDNRMQTGYSFLLQAPQGDLPVGFTPAFTPNEMLRLGVFEGKYMTDCAHEYPPEMFEGAKFSPDKPNPKTNAFMAKSRDGLKAWKHYGWIDPQDPRGWFEWYCRFGMGRRTPDDARQIARWTRFAGRHSRVIMASQQRGTQISDHVPARAYYNGPMTRSLTCPLCFTGQCQKKHSLFCS